MTSPAPSMPPRTPQPTGHHATRSPGGSGAGLVVGLLLLGVTAGALAIGFQRGQTRRCLAFYGPDVARRVSEAPLVEAWWLEPGGAPGVLRAVERRDVSQAPGLVHLRRGLVEDANFRWGDALPGTERLPAGNWDVALVFADPVRPGEAARLVIDLDDEGTLAVVGRPGRIGLGRIAAGLAKWLDDVR